MTQILAHVSLTPVLEIKYWPRSATRKKWFAITRQLIQENIANMDLDPAALAEVEKAFISARLL